MRWDAFMETEPPAKPPHCLLFLLFLLPLSSQLFIFLILFHLYRIAAADWLAEADPRATAS